MSACAGRMRQDRRLTQAVPLRAEDCSSAIHPHGQDSGASWTAAAASAAEGQSHATQLLALPEPLPQAATLQAEAAATFPALSQHVQHLTSVAQGSNRADTANVLPPHVPSQLARRATLQPAAQGVARAPGDQQFVPLAQGETILRVSVYSASDAKRRADFCVLGSQPLTALKDALYCPADTPHGSHALPASYFFIEGVAYDDTRPVHVRFDAHGRVAAVGRAALLPTPHPTDTAEAPAPGRLASLQPPRLSKPVVDWARSALRRRRPSGWGPVHSADMSETRFEQLSVRLGAHYLLLHAGDCQHVLVFTDIHEAHAGDEQNALQYPLHMHQNKVHRRTCDTCKLPATVQVFGDRLARSSPAYMCSQCYYALHYKSPAGEQLAYADYTVYPYAHD